MGLNFLDLFAGIGGFRLGMEAAGHKCVGWVEIDKFARRSYQAIHDTEGEWHKYNVRNVSDKLIRKLRRKRGPIHVICGGFPCQAFSIAGRRGGFNDTRGTLFFEIARFARSLRPQYLFLENVPGLLSHDKGNTFETILGAMDEIGYDAEWDSLNTKDFGIPQNRERLFIVGHLRGEHTRKIFPIQRNDGQVKTPIKKVGNIRKKGISQSGDVFDPTGISPTLCSTQTMKDPVKIISQFEPIPVLAPDRLNKRQNGRRFKEAGEPMFTITSQDRHGIFDGCQIRRLTPKECWRLHGIPDWAFERAAAVNSDSQLYKQAGNTVSIPPVYEIAKKFGVIG